MYAYEIVPISTLMHNCHAVQWESLAERIFGEFTLLKYLVGKSLANE